jgi:hypothetical protein
MDRSGMPVLIGFMHASPHEERSTTRQMKRGCIIIIIIIIMNKCLRIRLLYNLCFNQLISGK